MQSGLSDCSDKYPTQICRPIGLWFTSTLVIFTIGKIYNSLYRFFKWFRSCAAQTKKKRKRAGNKIIYTNNNDNVRGAKRE